MKCHAAGRAYGDSMAFQTDGLIDVEFALAFVALIRATGAACSPFLFLCPRCGRPIQPFAAPVPHLKHRPPNPACPLDPAPQRVT